MKNILIFTLLVAIGCKVGWDYLLSEKFQEYGDRTKSEWTCQVDFWLAESLVVLSQYDDAAKLLARAKDRCPDSEVGEESAFEYAHSLETGGKRAASIDAYLQFIDRYPNSARVRLAQKSVEMLRTS